MSANDYYASQGGYQGQGGYQAQGQGYPSQHQQQQQQGGYPPQAAPYGQGYYGEQQPVGGYNASHEQGPRYPDGNGPAFDQAGGGDRGIMGAMAGGAAGAYGGHKFGNHGILGGIGGAIAGSLAEDGAKKLAKHHKEHEEEKKREKEEKKRREEYEREEKQHHHQQQQHGYADYGQDRGYSHGNGTRGNFSGSARRIELEHGRELTASCLDVAGRERWSRLDLDRCVTNEWGTLKWSREGGFAGSCRDVRLVDGGRVLEAEADDGSGRWHRSALRLDERIGNEDGELRFVD